MRSPKLFIYNHRELWKKKNKACFQVAKNAEEVFSSDNCFPLSSSVRAPTIMTCRFICKERLLMESIEMEQEEPQDCRQALSTGSSSNALRLVRPGSALRVVPTPARLNASDTSLVEVRAPASSLREDREETRRVEKLPKNKGLDFVPTGILCYQPQDMPIKPSVV